MIACFPALLPDELFYSGCARFQSALGARGCHQRMREVLFGARGGKSAVELPGRLAAFASRLPPGSPYSVEYLVARHTVLPYYRPLKRPEQIARATQRLASDNVAGVRPLLLGGSRVVRPLFLQYCAACTRDNRQRYGVAYWHRTHQLPGVAYCHLHRSRLDASRVDRAAAETGHITLEDALRHPRDAAAPFAPRGGPHPAGGPATPSWPAAPLGNPTALRGLARDTAWLLEADRPSPGDSVLRDRYYDALGRAGLLQGSRVRVRAVRMRVEARYGVAVLDALGCALRDGDDRGWMMGAISTPTRAHPLHHLLLAPCVGLELPALLADASPGERRRASAGGSGGPRSEGPGTPARTRVPPCGQARGRGVKMVPTPEWERQLRRLVADPAVTQRAAARALGVAPLTLKRHAHRLGVWRDAWPVSERCRPGTRRAAQVVAHRAAARTTYEQLRREYPEKGRCELHAVAPQIVDWLWRNDRDWLATRQPARRPGSAGTVMTDWAARDRGLAPQIDAAADHLYALPTPRRVTPTAMLRRAGLLRVSHALKKLPGTRARLAARCETLDAFADRRLAWAAAQFIADARVPGGPSKLMRRAALSSGQVERLLPRARALVAEIAAAVGLPCCTP